MTPNKPLSQKNCGQKQNSTNGGTCNARRTGKVCNGMSLLSMWKIQGSQQSSTETAEDDVFLPSKNFKSTPKKVKASPKKPKILSKPTVFQKTKPESNDQNEKEDLGFCPNCQMPFAALIKQSQNWHLTECIDFDFQHLKECPSGASCSSTIPSHYLKYTHYGLAKSRSGISQNPASGLSSEKPNAASPLSEKIEVDASTPLVKPKNSFLKQNDSSLSQIVSPKMSNQLGHVSSSGSDFKNGDNSKLDTCNSTYSNMPPIQCSEVSRLSTEHGKSFNQNSGTFSRCSGSDTVTNSADKCWESSQKFENLECVPSKILTPGKISMSEAEKNQYRSNQCKRMLSDMLQTNSPMNEELTFFRNSVTDSRINGDCGPAVHVSLRDSSDSTKDAVSGMQRNIKCMKLDDSLTQKFVQFGDGAERFSRNLDSKVLSQSSTPEGKQLNILCSETAGGNDPNDSQEGKNIFDLANDWFSCDEFNTGDTTDRNFATNEFSEELFVDEDASVVKKKTVVQTVITKTSNDNSFNITLSPVKPVKLTPQKKPKSSLQPRNVSSCGKTEPVASPRKKQTSLMSFFKSSNPQKMTFVEPTDSVKNKSNKVSQPTKTFNPEQHLKSNGGRRNKICPYYKKIPGTTFAVDAFSYGSIPGINHYFLSHFHYDHYCGLTKQFQHPVYCSVVTANLVSLKIRLPGKYINTLKLNETVVIENVAVTILDANHCPGAVMFLFGLPDGQFILHTGDFRATPAMELYPSLKSCRIEKLFLDTTYCNPRYDFPSQDTILDMLTSLVVPRMKSNAKLLVVCGSYTIGKEKAFMAIAEGVDCKIWAETSKRNILNRLEDPRILSRLVTNEKAAKIHVRPMWMIKVSHLLEYLSKFHGVFNEIIGLKPTGWEHTFSASKNVFSLKPICQGPVTIYGVPYSEHSSFSELRNFVQFIKPEHVIPTVNVEKAQCRNQMALYVQQWLA